MCFPVGGKTKKVIDARQPGETDIPETLQTTTVRIGTSNIKYEVFFFGLAEEGRDVLFLGAVNHLYFIFIHLSLS